MASQFAATSAASHTMAASMNGVRALLAMDNEARFVLFIQVDAGPQPHSLSRGAGEGGEPYALRARPLRLEVRFATLIHIVIRYGALRLTQQGAQSNPPGRRTAASIHEPVSFKNNQGRRP